MKAIFRFGFHLFLNFIVQDPIRLFVFAGQYEEKWKMAKIEIELGYFKDRLQEIVSVKMFQQKCFIQSVCCRSRRLLWRVRGCTHSSWRGRRRS